MRMIDLGNHRSPLQIIDTATSVDCTKDIRLRRSFRSLLELMITACCGLHPSTTTTNNNNNNNNTASAATVTGTFFGYRHGRVSFSLHASTAGSHHHQSPLLLLLDLAVPTAYLAREMRHGTLRVALECPRARHRGPLFAAPAWTMYCNGRRVGFAVRRQLAESDSAVLGLMRSVSAGAGVVPTGDPNSGDLMYLRASFERVVGSPDSESFHMINPVGSTGQELSIFLLRS